MLQKASTTDGLTSGLHIPLTSNARGTGAAGVVAFLRRSRLLIGLCIAATITLGLAYLFLKTPMYEARTVMLVDANKPPGFQQRPAIRDPLTEIANLESHIEALRSDELALAVISELNLTHNPEFLRPGPIGSLLNRIWSPPSSDERELLSRALRLFRTRMTVARVQVSYALEISFLARDSGTAVSIVDAIAKTFIAQGIDEKIKSARAGSGWLQSQLREAQDKVLEADKDVENYKALHGMVQVGRGGDGREQFLEEKRLEDLNTQISAARLQVAEAEARLRIAEELAGQGGANVSRNELQLAKAKEDALRRRFVQETEALKDGEGRRAELRSLEAWAKGYRTVFEGLVQRYSDTLQGFFPVAEARILSPAMPSRSSVGTNVPLVLLIGLLSGSSLGIVLAFAREMFDQTVRSSRQVAELIHSRCLGVLPQVSNKKAAIVLGCGISSPASTIRRTLPAATRTAIMSPSSVYSETIRRAWMAVELRGISGINHVVGVTSAKVGEGKSTVAMNLALTAAKTGAATLLIGLDVQHGDGNWLQPGASHGDLQTLLRDKSFRQAATLVDTETGLHILAAGGPDLMGAGMPSRLARDLIDSTRQDYQFVVVDLGAAPTSIEVVAAAQSVDSLVLVVEWGKTPVRYLEALVQDPDWDSEQILGVLVNRVHPRRYKYYDPATG